jgi:serine/threonine protein kinase
LEETKDSTLCNCNEVVATLIEREAKTTIKDFLSIKVLGTGNYGKVMLVRHKKSNELYAMKVLKKKHIRERN